MAARWSRTCGEFPEEPETVQENLREIGPDILFYGARLWENVNRMVQAKMIDSTAVAAFPLPICLPLGYWMADISGIKRAVRVGYGRSIRWRTRRSSGNSGQTGPFQRPVVYSAGAAVSPEIIRFFQALGVSIKLFYGSTELGVVSVPRKGESGRRPPGPSSPGLRSSSPGKGKSW